MIQLVLLAHAVGMAVALVFWFAFRGVPHRGPRREGHAARVAARHVGEYRP